MTQQLNKTDLQGLLQADTIDDLSVSQIFDFFHAEESLQKFLPDAMYRIDPRDNTLVTYNSARASRPHDNVVEQPDAGPPKNPNCPICTANTTGVVDVAELSEGFTFINKNLFPILYPPKNGNTDGAVTPKGGPAYGLHLLQWTSSHHDKDWQNMPLEDRVTVLERLAQLERKLLFESAGTMPIAEPWKDGKNSHGYVSIIKNYGNLVGGSLVHGHQQIGFSNIMPRRFQKNLSFQERYGEPFSKFMLRETPDELLIRDYGEAVLMVPYFMRRPYDMLLLVKDVSKQYLCEMDLPELTAVAKGWHDAIKAMLTIMPRVNKEPAYNVTVSNGPGAGVYFEFLPYTQQTGGFEHLGLWVCQNNPTNAASHLRDLLDEF